MSVFRVNVKKQLSKFLTVLDKPGWDGYSAKPIDGLAVKNALTLIDSLPCGLPTPEVIPECDGEVGLDWFRAHDWQISVSVGSSPTFSYAARFGADEDFGTFENIDVLWNWIERLYKSEVTA